MMSFQKNSRGVVIEGILMKIEDDENYRHKFEVWFPYTLENINLVKEGAFLVIKNFATKNYEEHWSILEIVQIMPFHFAFSGLSKTPYPSYVERAAYNIRSDWEEQQSENFEPSTRIIIKAIPTDLEFYKYREEIKIKEEENIPILGESVYMLSPESTLFVINGNLLTYEEEANEN